MQSDLKPGPPNHLSDYSPSKYFPSPAAPFNAILVQQVNSRIRTMETFIMPAKYTKPSKSKDNWNVEFVSLPLLNDQKDAFIAWSQEAAGDVEIFVAQLLGTGYKVSMTLDSVNNCVICTATCKEERSPNNGYAMSSRSDGWLEALLMTCFKTLILYPEKEGGWPKNTRNDSWG